MRVKWSPFAKQQMLQIAKYIQKEFGNKYRDNFIQKVRGSNHIIGNNPDIGKVEPLLADSPFTYHSYVLNRLNKIVYRIDNDHVEVVDFWDVRQEPNALAERVK